MLACLRVVVLQFIYVCAWIWTRVCGHVCVLFVY